MPKISGVCVGESLVGEGNEVAHVDLLLGPRGSAVETAYCIGLTNNKDGFTTLLALVAPNLMCKPPTILYNKVTIKDARQAVQMFGPAQHAVANICTAWRASLIVTLLYRIVGGLHIRFGATNASRVVKPSLLLVSPMQ